ncbi:helix-turn-helix transcriptional regulator [Streptomyces gardneri]|uniref:helix-turn-helix domain-containing protein n=1 Tax=Nocardia abscessus TaxID=120957 RepID=UPI001895E633|nr:helix-turn-helix transcriptional regulator [Nocardia abscessus]MBF6169188.1 helix-turn-helix transcriptional regulator [Streptomyces gardneri]MBF6475272.1 helix-turn-helix transcriptional regulator [Nocardia abscessus]
MNNPEPEIGQPELAQRLKEVREYLGLSQQYVSSVTGIPRSAISEIERGNRKVDSLELAKLARLYQYPTDYFLSSRVAAEHPDAVLGRLLVDMTTKDQEQVRKFAEFLNFSSRSDRA